MGIFSKIAKGFKKIVKKVGRRIKKVAKGIGKVLGKIAKPFQKLGILGTIALSFIMPWAVGGILKGMGYLASSTFGTTAAGWAQSSNLFVKAAGRLAQGINFGAAKINEAYTFISDGISAGLDWVGQQGAKLKKGITNKYDAAKEWVTGTPTYDDALGEELFAGDDIFANVRQDVINIGEQSAQTIKSKGLDTTKDLVKKITTPKVSDNLLMTHGDRLLKAGTAAASKVFTLDTAKSEIVKAADEQPQASRTYDEGPTVAYLEVTPERISPEIDFSVKAVGGQYMSPLDSLQIMQNIRYV
tara:strand:+ start:2231 stop:3130 length:900 start_codon:yes stop_codon:yes gene_type:complete